MYPSGIHKNMPLVHRNCPVLGVGMNQYGETAMAIVIVACIIAGTSFYAGIRGKLASFGII